MRPVNLVPESQRRRAPTTRSNSSYVVLGILAACLVMSLVYVLTANRVTSRESAAAEASSEADRLEAQAASLGAFGDFAQIKEARAASVRDLAGGRFDWERLMRELARVLPSGSWLQAVDASVSGEAAESSSGAPQATLKGCIGQQSDVADLMVRLRRLHRVEDVTLNESVREDGTPSLESCGRLYQFDITAVFVASEVPERPAGATRVPASLGGGS